MHTLVSPSYARKVARTYKVKQKIPQDTELILELEAFLENGTTRKIKALVDTGAQANLVRQGLVPSHLTRTAKQPLQLIAANGQVISGGQKEAKLTFKFATTASEVPQPQVDEISAWFHIADIGVDAILLYPWLQQTQFGVFAHLNSLVKAHPQQVLMRPLSTSCEKDKSHQRHAHPKGQKSHERNINPVQVSQEKRKRSDSWIRERYVVRPEIVHKALTTLGVQPMLDAFADSGAHVLPRWWGAGGENEDAFQQNWNPEQVGLLWANPPFSVLPQVIHKVKKDKAKVVLVCPDWPYSRWWKAAQWLVVGDVYFPKGTKVFDCPDRPKLPATRWGTWVYLLDGSLHFPKEVKPRKNIQACVFSFLTRQVVEQEEERVEEFRRMVMEEYQ